MTARLRRALAGLGLGIGLGIWLAAGSAALAEEGPVAKLGTPPPPPVVAPNTTTADHSKFEILQQDFASGPEVTAACLSCHSLADDQMMHSIHFTWEYQSASGQLLGKRNVINAFCGNVSGNEPRCTSCHTGYGWEDMAQPAPAQSTAVDCLACHDRSGQYTKADSLAGHPPLDPVKPGTKTITGALAWPVDLAEAAQSVGMPGRDNCGNCHFYGGGGDNVKHGDLSSVLFAPSREVDVHMSADGANMTCTSCHVADQHEVSGSRADMMVGAHPEVSPGAGHAAASCVSCHGDTPHPATLAGLKLNDHTDVLACETCHIPAFARGGAATKTWWDWSTAGKLDASGKPYAEEGWTSPTTGKEYHTYMSQKGDFRWDEDVVPMYAWFDGHMHYTLADDTIDPTKVVEINRLGGAAGDPASRIAPFKTMEGRQAYDSGTDRLAFNHVFGPTTDTAFWTNFDWSKSIAAGMKAAGKEYSGEYGFVDTRMYWPINHMVAPADNALGCAECHAEDGRLAQIAGIYMPGTTPNSLVGWLGRLMVLAALAGVLGHGLLRLVAGKKGGSHE